MSQKPFTIALSGDSGGGKTTLAMLVHLALQAAGKKSCLRSENEWDPAREHTAKVIKLLRGFQVPETITAAALFSVGRRMMRPQLEKDSLDFDLYTFDRCLWDNVCYQGYQTGRPDLTMQEVFELNMTLDVWVPDHTFIVVGDTLEQCDLRRAYRDKKPMGTAGLMGGDLKNRQRIRDNFTALPALFPNERFTIINNFGTARPDAVERERLAMQNFQTQVLPVLQNLGLV